MTLVSGRIAQAILLFGAVVTVGFVAACDSAETPRSPASPERIVLIVIDTLRQDYVSAFGAKQATPNIDALAERGQIFPNVVSSYYQTTMSMASLFTGRTPSLESDDPKKPLSWNGRTWCGMRRFASDEADQSCIPESIPTLAENLRAAGYFTAGIVTNALLFRPLGFEQGFDEWVEVGAQERSRGGRVSGRFGTSSMMNRGFSQALSECRSWLDARPGDKFFLYVHFMDVHDYTMFRDKNYAAAVRLADQGVGEVIRALEDRDLLEGSVVVLISDHGERLGEKHFTKGLPYHFGHPSFEEHIRVPMIIAPPVVDDPDRPMRTDDVYRLIGSLAGISETRPADLVQGELFISEPTYQVYRKGRWKSFLDRETGVHSLVDLENDTREQIDVAADYPEIIGLHRDRMDELGEELGSGNSRQGELSEDDKRRLRELGYLE